MALHRARQTATECLRRELQRPAARRMLNETLFTSLAHARAVLAIWKDDYNTVDRTARLAISHRRSTPIAALPRCNGTGRCAMSRAPRPIPLHHRSHPGSNEPRTLPIAG